MHPNDQQTEMGTPHRVELRVTDARLRHRIAAALQRAGIDASSAGGPIEIALRRPGPGGSMRGGARLIELSDDRSLANSWTNEGPERNEALIELLQSTPYVRRAASRLGGARQVTVLIGESNLGAAAIVRRAQDDAAPLQIHHASKLGPEALERALATPGRLLIGDLEQLAPAVQRALSTRLQAGGIAAKVVLATRRELSTLAEREGFDANLVQLLTPHLVAIEPLRRRRDDLIGLTELLLGHFFSQLERGPAADLAPEAAQALRAHHWPGGLDELADALERAALLSDGRQITIEDLPPGLQDGRGANTELLPADWANRNLRDVRESAAAAAERAYLDAVLRHTRGVIKDAAEMCGIGPRSLYDRMQQHQLRKEDYKR